MKLFVKCKLKKKILKKGNRSTINLWLKYQQSINYQQFFLACRKSPDLNSRYSKPPRLNFQVLSSLSVYHIPLSSVLQFYGE